MLLAALLLLAQDAPPPSAPATAPAAVAAQSAGQPQGWSVKVDPCASARGGAEEIVVCGNVEPKPRLPLPAERGPPDHPIPSNPRMDGRGALAADFTPCAARIGGCQVGIDFFGMATFLVRAVGKAVDSESCCNEPGEATNFGKLASDVVKGVGKSFKKKDKRPRVAIPLDDSPFPIPAPADAAAEPTSAR